MNMLPLAKKMGLRFNAKAYRNDKLEKFQLPGKSMAEEA
jgi:hypothetical protein